MFTTLLATYLFQSNVQVKRKLHQSSPIIRLTSFMKKFEKNQSGHPHMLPMPLLGNFNDFTRLEIEMFFTALKMNGKLRYVDRYKSNSKFFVSFLSRMEYVCPFHSNRSMESRLEVVFQENRLRSINICVIMK